MWFVEVSHVLFRSPHGVYREYIQNQRLPIHTFAGDGHQALVCDSVPPGTNLLPLPGRAPHDPLCPLTPCTPRPLRASRAERHPLGRLPGRAHLPERAGRGPWHSNRATPGQGERGPVPRL